MSETFSSRLKETRIKAGLSQRDLGARAGITGVQVSRYESGEAEPRPRTMLKLASVLGVESEWLRTGQENTVNTVNLRLSQADWELLKRFARQLKMTPQELAKKIVMDRVDAILDEKVANDDHYGTPTRKTK